MQERLIFNRLIILAAAFCLVGCAPEAGPPQNTEPQPFAEITAEIGLQSNTISLPDGTYNLPEITGGGVALFDSDKDGDLDLLQVCSPPPGQFDKPAPNRFFQQGSDGQFRQMQVGLEDPGRGQGVAVGDINNDGSPDVYITNYGQDAFYRNQADGTFAAATAPAGFAGEHWSTSAAFVDYDRDGDLDLYVVHYVEFYPGAVCRSPDGREYCGPQNFNPTLDALYRNRGDGSFAEVTAAAGINDPGKGLGVVCADLNKDGWVDIFVANDGEVNQLWINQGNGTFVDEAPMLGVGFNAHGKPEASMGVAVGDVNADGHLDLFMTHLEDESNTLYTGTDKGLFVDNSGGSGMTAIDLPYTGFGCGFFDYDHDGDLDLALVNGRVERGAVFPRANLTPFWNLYAEPNLLFENQAYGRFKSIGSDLGGFGTRAEVDRGLAFGDLDGDGDLDLVVGGLGQVRVFRNQAPPSDHHWLLVRALVGPRDAIGAQITLTIADKKRIGLVLPAYSYASSSDPRAHFGLGKNPKIDDLEVLWPDGSRERFSLAGVDREVTLRQGQGNRL